jgi:hypothetical protein
MPEQHRYDVFERSEPAFELVSDEEMQRAHSHANDFDDEAVEVVKIARDVTAATAAELIGLSAHLIGELEEGIARDGAFCVGNLQESFEVRRASNDT